jgi:hypothetical protein
MSQLLTEYRPFNLNSTIAESARKSLKEGTQLIVEGVIQRAGAKNQNGRVYSKDILEREIENYKKGPIAERRALGELDHPDSSIINLNNVCHNILDIWWEGDDVMGKIEILSTPAGNILKELFANNITVGISSRGMGSVQESNGVLRVQEDFEILCWDMVSNPSTQGAYMRPTSLNESVSNKANPYMKVENIIRDIICDNTGMCQC